MNVRKDAPLELLGPFACSGQTGAGAVLNTMRPQPGDALCGVRGRRCWLIGAHGGKIAGCDPIIAIDIHDRRLALARELGATHALNTAASAIRVRDSRDHRQGARFSLETSAQPAVLREAVDASDAGRHLRAAGSARAGTEVSLEMPFLQFGRHRPRRHPRREPSAGTDPQAGRLPDARSAPGREMVSFYPLADINRAARDSMTAPRSSPSCACRTEERAVARVSQAGCVSAGSVGLHDGGCGGARAQGLYAPLRRASVLRMRPIRRVRYGRAWPGQAPGHDECQTSNSQN